MNAFPAERCQTSLLGRSRPAGRPVRHQRRHHARAAAARSVQRRHLPEAAQLGERDVEVGGSARAVAAERGRPPAPARGRGWRRGRRRGHGSTGPPTAGLRPPASTGRRSARSTTSWCSRSRSTTGGPAPGPRRGCGRRASHSPQRRGGVGLRAHGVADRGHHRPERRGVGDVDGVAGEDHGALRPGVPGQLLRPAASCRPRRPRRRAPPTRGRNGRRGRRRSAQRAPAPVPGAGRRPPHPPGGG